MKQHLVYGGLMLCTLWGCGSGGAGVDSQGVSSAVIDRLPLCEAGDPDLILPDLVALEAEDVRVFNSKEYFEKGELQRDTKRYAFFSTTVGNVGEGPLTIHARTLRQADGTKLAEAWQEIERTDGNSCIRLMGTFPFDVTGRAWFPQGLVTFELRDPTTGEVLATGENETLCLSDFATVSGQNVHTFPRTVRSRCELIGMPVQGLSAGWSARFDSDLGDQFIAIDSTSDAHVYEGNYLLYNVADAADLIWEANETWEQNATAVPVFVPARLTPIGEPFIPVE